MRILGIILLIIGILSLLLGGGAVGFFIIIVGIVLMLVGGSGAKDRKIAEESKKELEKIQENQKKEKEITEEREVYIAKRTKELMDTKDLSILEAKAQAEMEYILEQNEKNSEKKNSEEKERKIHYKIDLRWKSEVFTFLLKIKLDFLGVLI